MRAILKEKRGVTGECEGLQGKAMVRGGVRRLPPFSLQGRMEGELPDAITHCTEERR